MKTTRQLFKPVYKLRELKFLFLIFLKTINFINSKLIELLTNLIISEIYFNKIDIILLKINSVLIKN